jgi:hypothetical protein
MDLLVALTIPIVFLTTFVVARPPRPRSSSRRVVTTNSVVRSQFNE